MQTFIFSFSYLYFIINFLDAECHFCAVDFLLFAATLTLFFGLQSCMEYFYNYFCYSEELHYWR